MSQNAQGSALVELHRTLVREFVEELSSETFQLSEFQTWCASVSSSGELPSLKTTMTREEFKRLIGVTLSLGLCVYDPVTDQFTRYDFHPKMQEYFRRPQRFLPPGASVLAFSARYRQRVRSRWIHSDLRTFEAVEDASAGISEAIYIPLQGGATDRDWVLIAILALPMSAVFDILSDKLSDKLDSIAEIMSSSLRTLAGFPAIVPPPAGPSKLLASSPTLADRLDHLIRHTRSGSSILFGSIWEGQQAGQGVKWKLKILDTRADQITMRILRLLHLGSILSTYTDSVHHNLSSAIDTGKLESEIGEKDSTIGALFSFEGSISRYHLWVGSRPSAVLRFYHTRPSS